MSNTAETDTKGPGLAFLRNVAQEGLKYNAFVGRRPNHPIAVGPVDVLSLLDRIEELEAEAFKWHRMAAACEGWDEPSRK